MKLRFKCGKHGVPLRGVPYLSSTDEVYEFDLSVMWCPEQKESFVNECAQHFVIEHVTE